MMGDFELIGAAELDAYLRALGPLLLEACPAEGREQLALGLSRLDESRQALASKVEIVHRQSGAPEPVARVAAASAQQAADAAPRVLSAIVQGLGRLPLLLQRLEQVAVRRPSDSGGAALRTPSRRRRPRRRGGPHRARGGRGARGLAAGEGRSRAAAVPRPHPRARHRRRNGRDVPGARP